MVKPHTPDLSIVLPCYNEAPSLRALAERYRKASEAAHLAASQFELILVDNGSSDGSEATLRAITRDPQFGFVKVVTLRPNQGYGGGVAAGLAQARGKVVGFSHADEQCAPEDVFKAYALIQETPNALVKGWRVGRALSAWLFSRAFETVGIFLLRKFLREVNAQPKLFPSSALPAILDNAPKDFAFDLHCLLRCAELKLGTKLFKVNFPPRAHGESKWASTLRSRYRHSMGLVRFMLGYKPYQPEIQEEMRRAQGSYR